MRQTPPYGVPLALAVVLMLLAMGISPTASSESIISEPVTAQSEYRLMDVTNPESPSNLDPAKGITLVQGHSRKIQLQIKSGETFQPTAFTAKAESGEIAILSQEDSTYKIEGGGVKGEETTTVSVDSAGETRFQFPVKVLEAVKSIELSMPSGQTLPEGQSLKLKVNAIGEKDTNFKLSERAVEVSRDQAEQSNLVVAVKEPDGIVFRAGSLASLTPVPQKKSIKFILQSNQGKTTAPVKSEFVVVVIPSVGHINFEPVIREPLLPQGVVSTKAVVRKKDNTIVDLKVDFSFENQGDAVWADLAPEGNSLRVYWREPGEEEARLSDGRKKIRPSSLRILARAFDGENEIKSTLVVHMAEVAKFAPLRVKLNIMDQLTAEDLYGGPLSKEYYVLIVRMFNDLKDPDNGQYTGTSILAYSSSIEVAVGLEKKYNKGLKSDVTVIPGSEAKVIAKQRSDEVVAHLKAQLELDKTISSSLRKRLMAAATKVEQLETAALDREREVQVLELDVARDNKKADDLRKKKIESRKARESADAALAELSRLQLSLYASSVTTQLPYPNFQSNVPTTAAIDDGKWHPASRDDLMQVKGPYYNPNDFALPKREDVPDTSYGEPPCINTITYRPFTFEMMVNSVDRRNQRSLRATVFRFLEGIAIGTSFITAIAVPGPSSDLPLGIEKYSNLFIPGASKLYPDYKEQHRQNIVSQAMKPIEEIPFGSDVTRVIFIPKKEIQGLIPGHDSRISQVCPYFFRVQVAVVKKAGFAQTGSQAP